MLLIFMGPSSTGKTTAAENFRKYYNLQVFTGKDYLRLAKNEEEAWKLFSDKLMTASNHQELSSNSIIYIISEKSFMQKLAPFQKAVHVKFTADYNTIKKRFAKRMNGYLPASMEKMLEKQVTEWKDVNANINIDTTILDPSEVVSKINEKLYLG